MSLGSNMEQANHVGVENDGDMVAVVQKNRNAE
jgi:hypothetical protein